MNATPDFTWLFVKMILGLILVLILAVFFLRVVLPRTRMGRMRQGHWASILDGVKVDQTKTLYLIKILERYFVMAAGEHSFQVVTELTREEGDKALKGDEK